jgi:predicted nucleic acid-binding protein
MIIGDSSALIALSYVNQYYIKAVKPLLEKLQTTNIFISDKLVEKVLSICGE